MMPFIVIFVATVFMIIGSFKIKGENMKLVKYILLFGGCILFVMNLLIKLF